MARIQPGLERIAALLKGVDFPWKSIHVAGTNGKGSICNYASSMLVGRGVKVGKFTSPHLVDRWDCITINGKPINEPQFSIVERHYSKVNEKHNIGASPFEILTATAFTIFNDAKVNVGVVEVGMGGRLDSTNVLNNQAVSVISRIARDHEGFLGNTLSEIASHKAGILKPGVPYIVSPANEFNVQAVIQDYAKEIGAGDRLSLTSFGLQEKLYTLSRWQRFTSSMLPFQIENLKLAVVATMQVLDSLHGAHTTDQINKPKDLAKQAKMREIAKTLLSNASIQNPGRQEMLHLPPVFRNSSERRNQVLIDGAHNPNAAVALDTFIRQNLRLGATPRTERPDSGWPVTWVLAMTEGKDAREYLATLLKAGDKVVTTTFGPVAGMPWVKPMDPKELLEIAKSVAPQITGVHVPITGALRAVCTAKYLSNRIAPWSPIVVTGSLYLVGDLHRELRPRADKHWWTDEDPAVAADRELFLRIQAEERERVKSVLSPIPEDTGKLQDELDALNREIEHLRVEKESLSAPERLEHEDQQFAELYATPEQVAAHLARAEAAKRALARHEESVAAAAQRAAIKAEEKHARQERIVERKEHKREKRIQEREQKLRVTGSGRTGRRTP
ncbi:folylpolyglutamate synthase [Curvularia kusanoi]|uniref:Folylpolyglutamate synthase n=1 Tax=Curvularia kusanoi TaxID=90978 RepID=A0A9P4TLQ8_CURKU|nr:folylpolyglutamate synthase [Curvularia kusanoi]